MLIWIAFFFSALTYLHNDIFIDFADEGFLWYGVLQVMQGFVPIRDFQSYDPGRYYWCAAIMSFCCKGIMGLRFSAGVFQFVALVCGLAVAKRIKPSLWFLFLSGLLMTVWMLIPWRYFDAGMALIVSYFAVRMADHPSRKNYFFGGAITALAAFFGINHGLYAGFGMALLILYLEAKKCGGGISGVRSGYLPGLLTGLLPFSAMLLFVPGFAGQYWQQISSTAWSMSSGRMMTSRPIAWPWEVHWTDINPLLQTSAGRILEFVNIFSGSCLYLLMAVFYVVSFILILKNRAIDHPVKAVWVASFFVGLAYVRHAFSHANICYLGEGILPVWIGLTALAAAPGKKIIRSAALMLAIFFTALSLGAAGLIHSITFKNMVMKDAMTWYPVGTDKIWVPREDAAYIEDVKALVNTYVAPDEPVLLAPLLTTFYCLLEKRSPVHELYFHIAPMPGRQRRTVQQLEEQNVRWAIVANVLIEGRPEQSLPNSHPILWQYLMEKFDPVPTTGLKTGYFLMKRRE